MIEETANKAKHGEMEEDRSPGTGALMNLQNGQRGREAWPGPCTIY